MDDFISDDDLLTFEGFLRYQVVDPDTTAKDQLEQWHQIFEESLERCKASQKVGLMKLQPVPGEEKYAVAIREGSDLWLTLWVRCSRKGEVFVMYPRAERDWDAHASYHLDGTLHQKSHGRVMEPVLKRQPLTAAFTGAETLGVYGGHGKSSGAVCNPAAFTGVVAVEPGILGPRHGAIAIDLIGPGAEPIPFIGKVVQQQTFTRGNRPSVDITIGIPGMAE